MVDIEYTPTQNILSKTKRLLEGHTRTYVIMDHGEESCPASECKKKKKDWTDNERVFSVGMRNVGGHRGFQPL